MEKKISTGNTIGKYIIKERVGRGGMAEVYKAYHQNLNRHVAIKIMHPYLSDDGNFLTRFRREARAMATAEHPNIVHVYDFDTEDDYYYIVMEFLAGGTLKEKIDRLSSSGQSMPLSVAARIILEMADALAYAHSCSMIHRDLKPANIMFNERGGAVLTDFGIAKLMTSTSYMTNTGAMIGTPAYMSPEQGLGEPGDERSDIYSLGVLAYQLLTGRLPHEGDTPLAVVLKHINDTPIRPTVFNPDLPVEFEEIVLMAMTKDPENRYQSASDLAKALRLIIKQTAEFSDKFSIPASLLENHPTPLPGKTMVPVNEIGPTPEVVELSKSLPRPAPVSSSPTMIGEAGFASEVPVHIDDSHAGEIVPPSAVFAAHKPDPSSNRSEVEEADLINEEILSTNHAHGLPQDAQVRDHSMNPPTDGEFTDQMSAAIDRLTDDPDPILSTRHERRIERRQKYNEEKTVARRRQGIHAVVMVLVIVAGLSLGMFTYQNYFAPEIAGQNPVERFNQWLNQASGGTTAEEIDMSATDDAPTTDPETSPTSSSGQGIVLQISNMPTDTAGWQPVVEVQLQDGSWQEVSDWSAVLDDDGSASVPLNLISPNENLYRWALYDNASAATPLAISDVFIISSEEELPLEITINLE